MIAKRTENIKSGFSIFFIKNLIFRAASLVSSIVLAKFLTPADFGIVAISYVLINIISVLSRSGVGEYILVNYPKSDTTEKKKIISNAIFSQLLITFAVVIVFCIALPFWSKYNSDVRIIYLSYFIIINFVFSQIKSLSDNVILSNQKFMVIFYISLVPGILVPVGKIFCAYIGLGIYSLIIPSTLFIFITMLISLRVSKLRFCFSDVSKKMIKKTFDFSKYLYGANVLASLSDHVENIIVAKYFNLKTLGIYNMGNMMATVIPLTLERSTNTVLKSALPSIKNKGIVIKKYLSFVDYALFFTYPIFALIFISIDDIIKILYNDNWYSVIDVVRILILYSLIRVGTGSAGSLINTLEVTNITWKLNVIYVIYHIPLIIALSSFGFLGLCWAIVISKTLGTVVLFYYLKKQTNLSYKLSILPIFKAIVTFSISVTITYYLLSLFVIDNLVISIFIKSSLIFIIYLFTFIWLYSVKELKIKLNTLLKFIKQYMK